MSTGLCPTCGDPIPKRPPSQALKYCGHKCAGAAKRTLPTVKTCEVCHETYEPQDRYQAARSKTCSKACHARRISEANSGRPSPLNRQVTEPCAHCGTSVTRPPSHMARPGKKYCSRTCRAQANPNVLVPYAANGKGRKGTPRYGEDNPAWKGGVTYRRGKGNYIGPRYVRCPEKWLMMARKDGYIMEHRLVMAEWVGRPLTRTEVVNHKNHDPRDNRRENLELYPTNGDHKRGEVDRFVDGVCNRWEPSTITH